MSNPYVGTWSLQDFVIHPKEGPQRPWGQSITGLLVYSESGHVSVSINRAVDESDSNKDQAILNSVLFYAGTYSVEGGTILHKVTQATNPQRIGREMIRYAKLEDTTLTLTTPDEDFGKAILIWRKIG